MQFMITSVISMLREVLEIKHEEPLRDKEQFDLDKAT